MQSLRALAVAAAAAAALPAFGAPTATEAYRQYREALSKAKTIDEVLPFLAKDRKAEIEKTPADERAANFEALKSLSEVVELKVTKETATRAGAMLQVQAVTGAGEDTTATVQMAKEDGTFKVGKETWSSQSDSGPAKSCEQLAAEVKSASPVARARAANALQQPRFRFSAPCLAAVPALIDALADPVAGIRLNASNALAAALPGAARQQPEAISRFKDQLPRLTTAKQAARKAGDEPAELFLQNAVAAFGVDAVAILEKDLSHPSRTLRWGAAKGLEALGPAGKKALPAVRAAAKSEKDQGVRDALADAEKALQGK